jgi:L-serine/L-threonine ammonia-lyase
LDSRDDADRIARAVVAENQGATYVHPFDGDTLTRGHASLIHELALQLPSHGITHPSLLICSVGGGGLIRGLIHGLESTSALGKPKIIGVNDFGADSFAQSWNTWLEKGGEPSVVTIPGITSKATSMGARTCSIDTLRSAVRYADSGPGERSEKFTSLTVDDAISGSACWQFKRDHGLMVEMACGASLAPCYQPRILDELLKGAGKEGERKSIVIVVCGGSKVDEELLRTYEREYGLATDKGFRAMVDGRML